MKTICFYHKVDFDGKGSGFLVNHFLSNTEVELIGVDYGDKIPFEKIDKDTIVYVVDFSFTNKEKYPNNHYEYMLELQGACKKLFWYDHHYSAIKALENYNISGLQMVGYAAIEIVYAALGEKNLRLNEVSFPRWIKLLGRYDIWDNSNKDLWDKEILPFQHGLKMYGNFGIDSIFNLIISAGKNADSLIDKIIEKGNMINDYLNISYASLVKNRAFEITFEKLKFICCNCTTHSSQIFNSIDSSKYDAMMVFSNIKGDH